MAAYALEPTPTPKADVLQVEQNTPVQLVSIMQAYADVEQIFAGMDWNPTALNFPRASELLRNCVKEACIQKLGMKAHLATSPLDFIMEDGVPEKFHVINDNPRGCVDVKVQVREVNRATGKTLNQWLIHIDADQENPGKQKPHFGYDVSGSTGTSKFTGHVWLPHNPPNYRDDGKPGRDDVKSNFERRKGGDIWFEITKIMRMFRF